MLWRRYIDKIFALLQADWEDSTEDDKMDDDTLKVVHRNLHWQGELGWDLPTVVKVLGSMNITSVESSLFVSEVKAWQRRRGLVADGIIGPSTWELMLDYSLSPLDRSIRLIMEPTIGKESGGRYWATNRDGEFEGRFRNHRATGKIHIGLSFGALQFSQDSGSLGKYLSKCAKSNPSRFKSIMGPTWDSLLTTLNKPGASGMRTNSLRGPRVHPVPVIIDANGTIGDVDIWKTPWVEKFERLGRVPEFQAVQREIATEDYLIPILATLKKYNFLSEKMVAIAFSGAIHRGVGGMRKFLESCNIDKDTERVAVDKIVANDANRFLSIANDDNLRWSKWEGWDLINL